VICHSNPFLCLHNGCSERFTSAGDALRHPNSPEHLPVSVLLCPVPCCRAAVSGHRFSAGNIRDSLITKRCPEEVTIDLDTARLELRKAKGTLTPSARHIACQAGTDGPILQSTTWFVAGQRKSCRAAGLVRIWSCWMMSSHLPQGSCVNSQSWNTSLGINSSIPL
jgi:hypothetical protein